jgi:transposase
MFIMESMGKKKPRPRRSFTPEFKAEIVELCQRGDRSVGHTGIAEARRTRRRHPHRRVATTERDELAQLRRQNRRLREDVEILKWATALFVQETR